MNKNIMACLIMLMVFGTMPQAYLQAMEPQSKKQKLDDYKTELESKYDTLEEEYNRFLKTLRELLARSAPGVSREKEIANSNLRALLSNWWKKLDQTRQEASE